MRLISAPHVVARAARNVISMAEIKLNRAMGRERVPSQPDILFIETSSTCNLKCRFCPYDKKQNLKTTMSDAMFEDCVNQAVALGYRNFELTPCTGDIFMDRRILKKLQFLEDHPQVEGYHFFTNFSIPKTQQIARLLELRKLKVVTVSIYGHDLPSFIAITKSTETVYRRLLRNLETLYAGLADAKFKLSIGHRTATDAPRRPASDLAKILERFRARGIPTRKSHIYNNWGGMISSADVEGLAINVTSAENTYKNGACSLLFTTVQVLATGIVNGCACRDVEATLQIGDIKTTPLRDIISGGNPAYRQLIEEQQRGEFRPVCRSCDFYKSIYHHRERDRVAGTEMLTIQQFVERTDARGQFADASEPQNEEAVRVAAPPV
jgi:sulfatase maturation enzyme AslB (radical SAM superfamily)